MIYKALFLTLLFFNFSFASFQEVRIGKIDDYYSDKITEEDLRYIIDEIEELFETQLDMNVFDYSNAGKDIDIIYVPPSKLEQRISKKLQKLEIKKNKLKRIQNTFSSKQEEIDEFRDNLKEENDFVNEKVESLNEYVSEVNKIKRISKEEYYKVKKYTKSERSKINKEIKSLRKKQLNLKRLINKYNQKIYSYRTLINDYNRLNNEIEAMSRSFRKVKGTTFAAKEITLKTSYKNGKKVRKKSVKTLMNKIEIYGFENLNELKVILAHEIAHLVGIPHIESKNALLNPILQKNQYEKLTLTQDDILNFEENF